MPPKNPRKRPSESYGSDSGFIADAPAPKKTKANAVKAPLNTPSNGKKGKGGAADEGFWEISNNRRVTISEFGGKKMVNIREYYEKDGESLPGKKGISMPVEQFGTLVTLLPRIESALRAQGIEVPRPDYGGGGEAGVGEVEGGEDVGEDDGGGEEGGKKNFEETSEEEEG